MHVLTQYGFARVVQLLHPLEEYDGWRLNRRPPHIGDVGIVVDILQAPGQPDHYVVEMSDAEGITIWLGDFDAEELEPIDESEYTRPNTLLEPPDTA
jgi:hypothetical protein